MVIGQVLQVFAKVGQYLVPLLLLAGAAASAIRRRKRKRLLAGVAADADGRVLRAMSWHDFELLVGEAFRRRGFSVTETGGGGADGGVDLHLTRGSETFLVQCKHWKAFKVPVNVVRELYGVMAAQGVAGGLVVTSGVFTAEAQAFARGCNIDLIDGQALKRMIAAVQPALASRATSRPAAAPVADLLCPRCGSAMVRRVARQGANAGKAFRGCSRYPQCRGVRSGEA
jgi:restriction system protein